MNSKNNSMDIITEKNEKQYDTHAKDWQIAMDSNVGHKYLEKPAMERELPEDLMGKTVLCIGVGSGDELIEILKKHPSKIVGIDVSTKLLDIAKTRFPHVEFQKMEMADLHFPDNNFDFIYSSLTFHYAKDWDLLLSEVGRVLRDDGELLFSTHHPIYWGRQTPTGNKYINARGITLTEHTAVLPADIEITYYNHANEDAIREAVGYAGFEIIHSFAPSVIDVPLNNMSENESVKYQKLKIKNKETPLFLIVKAVKKRNRDRKVMG